MSTGILAVFFIVILVVFHLLMSRNIHESSIRALKELERDGLVLRREYMEVPIRVEYELTEKAARLRPILEMMVTWALGEESQPV